MNKKILLIDDNVELGNELAELFREEGYLVDKASDSGQGTILIQKSKYDICLLDYKMKGLDGIDLLKMIKDLNPQCAVFIVSGKVSIEELIEKEKVADLVAGVIRKPFDIESLLEKVRAIT